MFSKIGLQFRYYRVLSKALLGFSVPDNQPSMTAHYNPDREPDLERNHLLQNSEKNERIQRRKENLAGDNVIGQVQY